MPPLLPGVGQGRLRSIFRPRKVALYILLAVIAALMFVPAQRVGERSSW